MGAWFDVVVVVAGAFFQGKGIILTSDIGNVRHSFKCRNRTSLLAAFAELQVRGSESESDACNLGPQYNETCCRFFCPVHTLPCRILESHAAVVTNDSI